jgi:hypothetical protein
MEDGKSETAEKVEIIVKVSRTDSHGDYSYTRCNNCYACNFCSENSLISREVCIYRCLWCWKITEEDMERQDREFTLISRNMDGDVIKYWAKKSLKMMDLVDDYVTKDSNDTEELCLRCIRPYDICCCCIVNKK